MTNSKKNSILSLFASIQLALFLLFLLSATSIIGTVIPQNSPHAVYIEKYGPKMAHFFQLLEIPDMYNSWWFLALLTFFALNLTVCSLERIPRVIRTLRRDGLAVLPEQLITFPFHRELQVSEPARLASSRVLALLKAQGWTIREAEKNEGHLLFAQKGGWSRFGVYVVHCSILLILAGAMVGSSTVARKILNNPQFAFKGSIMLPEGQTTSHIIASKSGGHIDLGFQLRCDTFDIEYYPNGMAKTYRSRVTVLENDKSVLTTDIEVNHPLTYKGVTFYQSSYQPYQKYQISLKNQKTGAETTALVTAAKRMDWPEGEVSYGIINRESQGEATRRLKIWFTDNLGEPSIFWINNNQEAVIERPSGTYSLTLRQMYATGLQAAKDPGIWLVYSGCLLMLIGLYIAFFLSHRKVYVFIKTEHEGSRILFAGEANKNKRDFESKFAEIISKIEK